MPIYEYRCLACRKRSSVFVRSVSSPATPACEHCGSKKMTRLMSKFAVHGLPRRGASDYDDDLGGLDDVDENDPRSVARWARKMSADMGEDMGPEFDEMIGRMEAGEDVEGMMGDDDADDDYGGDDF
jgi:putative FmdB family regulatory protein